MRYVLPDIIDCTRGLLKNMREFAAEVYIERINIDIKSKGAMDALLYVVNIDECLQKLEEYEASIKKVEQILKTRLDEMNKYEQR